MPVTKAKTTSLPKQQKRDHTWRQVKCKNIDDVMIMVNWQKKKVDVLYDGKRA